MGRIKVRGIIPLENKFLFVRNKTSNGYFWCLPGGGVEEGEDLLSALSREIIEELGVKPEIGNLIYVHQFKKDAGFSSPGFYFYITNGADFVKFNYIKSSHGLLELSEAGFIDVTENVVLPDFLKSELPELNKKRFDTNVRIRIIN